MNQILIITPFKQNGVWVFDDPRVGLVREPFVPSFGDIIDAWLKDVPNAEKGFNLFFSAAPFQDHSIHLEWERNEYGGNVYSSKQYGLEGWLCPALLRYFDAPPPELYGRAVAI